MAVSCKLAKNIIGKNFGFPASVLNFLRLTYIKEKIKFFSDFLKLLASNFV